MPDFTVANGYVISGVKKDGTRFYAAKDSNSGGYLYWTTHYDRAEHYSVPTMSVDAYLKKEGQDEVAIEILEVTAIATVVTSDDIIAQVRRAAQEKIDKINADLQKELDKLAKA